MRLLGVGLGILLMSATVVFHVTGTIERVLFVFRRRSNIDQDHRRAQRVIRLLFLTTMVILGLHVAEFLLWAAAYYFLPGGASPGCFNDCVYLSMVTFTTLGYGDVIITDRHWRILAGIQAMGGMLAFGWSAALLFATMQQAVGNLSNQNEELPVQ